jgi:polysaccharide pyruvyl transferase WcaK-like protein
MSEDATKILIAEYMPSLNKGGLELLEGILKTFDALGQVDVAVFSLYPALDSKRYPAGWHLIDICRDLHVERFLRGSSASSQLLASVYAGTQHLFFVLLFTLFGKNATGLMKSPLWQRYCSTDVFIACINEDDCVNGNYLRFSPVYISMLAKSLRKPVIVYANSTTKTTNSVWIWRWQSRMVWRILATYFLNNMDLITTRDRITYELYKSFIKGKTPLHFTGDVGILMDPVDPLRAKRIMKQEKIVKDGRLLVGASITRRLLLHAFPEYPNYKERYEKGVSEIAKVFDRLVAGYHADIVFIPHCIEHTRNNDDRIVGRDIVKKMESKSNVKVITNEYSPQELKGLIEQFDIFVGDRVHALISALSMNVPCCVLAYRSDKRPYNLIGKDFKQEKWIFEVETLTSDALYRLLTELVLASEEIRRNLPLLTQHAKERACLNGQLLKILVDTRATKSQKHA